MKDIRAENFQSKKSEILFLDYTKNFKAFEKVQKNK